MRSTGNEAAQLWTYGNDKTGTEWSERKESGMRQDLSIKAQQEAGQRAHQGQSVPPRRRRSEGPNRQEQIKRQNYAQQLQQQVRKGKRLTAALFFTWCFLVVNLIFLLVLYRKVRSMDELLEQAVLQTRVSAAVDQKEQAGHTDSGITTDAADAMGQAVQTVKEDYPDIWGLDRVDSPRKRTERQVLDRLAELAEENRLIDEIYGDRKSYPDKLLEALANNPEMAGFVAGYPDGKPKSTGLTESEKEKEFPLFLQWDPRWGYDSYGDDSNIGLAGCGPTCISMVLYYLTGDEKLTPDVIGEYSMKNGYYVSGVGTAWALLEDVPAMYGVDVVQQGIKEENLKQALDWGGVAVCSMSEGDFTAAGHFIVIYGYDSEGFLVNDPNCVARSRQHWSWDSLRGQIKNMWLYQKG